MQLLITGRPNSGKSAFAEKLALPWRDVVYFATLPVTPSTRERIQRHQERRPAHWRMVAASGDAVADVAALSATLTASSLLLVDGVAQYLTLVHFSQGQRSVASPDALRSCAEIFGSFVADWRRWLVVDVDAASRNAAPLSGIDHAVGTVHERLKQRGLTLQLERTPPTAAAPSAGRPPCA